LNTTLADRFRRWFAYEQDSHAKVLASLETVPAANRASREYQRALSIVGHIIAARRAWLFRMGAAATGPRPDEFFPEGVTLAELAGSMHAMESAWSAFLAGLDDDALARTFEYQSFDSGGFRNTIEEILTTLFGHSSYHRGQIAMLVRTAGGQPAATDFVYWARQAIDKD
jgi:uncharacterized damage-inducible protein DinB